MSLNPQETADLVTFTEEILNRELHFLCSVFKLSSLSEALESRYLYVKHIYIIDLKK